jgi:protein arginine N-methyltransferase 3
MLIVPALDFYSSIKLVNYIREQVKNGNTKPDTSSPSTFADEKYLQPVLGDDALLFSLDELVPGEDAATQLKDGDPSPLAENGSAQTQVSDLEKQLQSIQAQFSDYRRQVEETLERRWNEADGGGPSTTPGKTGPDYDGNYFDSYSYNGIFNLQILCVEMRLTLSRHP